jgi:hypothetical protein
MMRPGDDCDDDTGGERALSMEATAMATFVPDTDPELRSLLAACQTADDVRPPMSALADWLEARGDPRDQLVRLGGRFWELIYLKGGQDEDMAGLCELERRMIEEGDPVLAEWLRLPRRTSSASIEWSSPLPHVHLSAYRHLPPEARETVRELLRAGWVWVLQFEFVDEAFAELLSLGVPIRELRFDENQALRDPDLEVVARVPHLRELDLRQTRIKDAGLRHLYGVRTLRRVFMERSWVSNAGVQALQKELPECEVRR